jgi:hypothetical protein
MSLRGLIHEQDDAISPEQVEASCTGLGCGRFASGLGGAARALARGAGVADAAERLGRAHARRLHAGPPRLIVMERCDMSLHQLIHEHDDAISPEQVEAILQQAGRQAGRQGKQGGEGGRQGNPSARPEGLASLPRTEGVAPLAACGQRAGARPRKEEGRPFHTAVLLAVSRFCYSLQCFAIAYLVGKLEVVLWLRA